MENLGIMSTEPVIQPSNHTCNISIRSLVAPWADKTPDAIALLAPDRPPITYARLLAQIDTTVKQLNSMGIGRNDRVAVVLPNGPEMAVALLSVASSATCAPLNPAYNAREFTFYLSDLKAKALVAQHGIDSPSIAAAKKLGIPVIQLIPTAGAEAGVFTLEGKRMSRPDGVCLAHPEDLAFVLHTSGTTSRPKIVPLTHTNICTSAHNVRTVRNLGQNDRCLNVMPLFHLHGMIYALFSLLMVGASTICTPGFDSTKFFGWLRYFQPTWYTAVPTIHQSILARADFDAQIINRCPLRFIGDRKSVV